MSRSAPLAGLFERKLLLVSGKGGVGKTSVAAALGLLAARDGKTVLLMSSDGRGDAAPLFGGKDAGYREVVLAPRLHGMTTNFDSLLDDFVRTAAPVRFVANRILSSDTFRYFTRATPGLPDLLLLGKVRELFKRARGTKVEPRYDLVILDAPASGHALSLLALPRTLVRSAPPGPLRKIAHDLDVLLSDPASSALVVVAEPAELAAREAEELVEGAKTKAGLSTALLVVNRVGRGGARGEREEVLPKIDIPTVFVPEIETTEEEDEERERRKESKERNEREGREGRFASKVNGTDASPRPARRDSSAGRSKFEAAAGRRDSAAESTSEEEEFFAEFLFTFEENAAAPRSGVHPKRSPPGPARETKRNSSGRAVQPFDPLYLVSHPLSLEPWLDTSHLLALTGPGGVGKTTLSAAVGIAAARRGRRVLVLTVDPARRLAQALGLGARAGRSDRPVAVSVSGLPPGAALFAMQIDPKASFERLLARVASPATVARIQANRLYAGLVDSLPGVLEYMGVEALAERAKDPGIDLIVLDTPPAARGLDFLSAPDRMVQLLSNDALRWFLRSDSLLGRALSGASRGAAALLKLADRALGFGFLADLADFFRVFDGLYDGFQARSREISALLSHGRFFVVSSLDHSALRTASETAEGLRKRGVETALLLNRVPSRGRSRPSLPHGLAGLPAIAVLESGAPALTLPSDLADALLRVP